MGGERWIAPPPKIQKEKRGRKKGERKKGGQRKRKTKEQRFQSLEGIQKK